LRRAPSGAQGTELLLTIDWDRASALITLFAPPWGPKTPTLAPQFPYTADPGTNDAAGAKTPGRRKTYGAPGCERQLEGIAKAKAAGVYKGRPASIEASRVRELKAAGMRPTDIAKALKIGRASVYRVLGSMA
jgi:Helix-turn-helix domain of resolvase